MKYLFLIIAFVSLNTQAQLSRAYMDDYEAKQRDLTLAENSHRKLMSPHSPDTGIFSASSSNFDVHFYRCHWYVNPEVRYIRGEVSVHFKTLNDLSSITIDLSSALVTDSILYHGVRINFVHAPNNGLKIHLPANLRTNQFDSISIYYQGVPNTGGVAGTFAQRFHGAIPVLYTLSEPFGSREWWPCKNGLSDKADSIDITITNPSVYTASSNGIQVSEEISNGQKTTYFKHRYPIASYLVAMAVTNYVKDTDSIRLSGSSLPLHLYSYPENRNSFLPVFGSTKTSLSLFSELFGPYPFLNEHYSNTFFPPNGGIEHQTNSFIGSTWEQLVAHEACHQWFGNKVTCGSWSDIWLNEGYATYSQYLYVAKVSPQLKQSHLQGLINIITAQPGGSVYVKDTNSVAAIFNSRLSYNKAAYVLHMLRFILGDSTFFMASRQYLNDPLISYGFARTADLIRHFEQVSGKDLNEFFEQWIYKEGYPDYDADWTQNNNNWVQVRLNQTPSHSSVSFFNLPIELQFRNNTRDTSFIVQHNFNGQLFSINPGFDADTLIIDPERWILSKVKNTKRVDPASDIPNRILIYPNPAPRELLIKLDNPTDKKLQLDLFNAVGQLVFSQSHSTNGNNELFQIDMQHYSRGVYWIKITSERAVQMVRKIVH